MRKNVILQQAIEVLTLTNPSIKTLMTSDLPANPTGLRSAQEVKETE